MFCKHCKLVPGMWKISNYQADFIVLHDSILCFQVEVEEIEDDLPKREGDVTTLLVIIVTIDSISVCVHV